MSLVQAQNTGEGEVSAPVLSDSGATQAPLLWVQVKVKFSRYRPEQALGDPEG